MAHNPNPIIGDRVTLSRAATARQSKQQHCILKNDHFDPDSVGGSTCKDIQINLEDWLSQKPHCLGGRATAVLGSFDGDLACKISFPEFARENEGQIIVGLRQQIEENIE